MAAHEMLEKLIAFYVEVEEEAAETEAFEESETIERDVQRMIEAGQNVIKVGASKSHGSHEDRNRYFKPLAVPTFSGDKRKFEDVWALLLVS